MSEKEENVYGEQSGAENVAEAKAERGESVSAALGKFKDVDALLKAYGSLQSEFTRRSQRLKELERQAEELKAKGERTSENAAATGAEKLRKNAEARRAEGKRFDEFVSKLGQTETPKKEEVGEPIDEGFTGDGSETQADLGEGTAEKRLSEGDVATSFVANGRKDVGLSSEELYTLASRDENVRLKIVGEYLSSVGRAGAPLVKGGAGIVAAPMKAKSIDEAGSMALRFFKKDGAGI